jgi:hypothetical protein
MTRLVMPGAPRSTLPHRRHRTSALPFGRRYPTPDLITAAQAAWTAAWAPLGCIAAIGALMHAVSFNQAHPTSIRGSTTMAAQPRPEEKAPCTSSVPTTSY